MATKNRCPPSDSNGIFSGMVVFLVDNGVQKRRLQIWKQKLLQMGAIIEEESLSRNVTHVFAMNSDSIRQKFGPKLLQRFKGAILQYQWLEDSLSIGEKVSEKSYIIQLVSGQDSIKNPSNQKSSEPVDEPKSSDSELNSYKKLKPSPKDSKSSGPEIEGKSLNDSVDSVPHTGYNSKNTSYPRSPSSVSSVNLDQQNTVSLPDASLPYHPPDLNRNITEIFGKLINIYRALGDDRRSFSYYKAIPVIERLPFKIQSVDQVKDLPAIGKSMQDHIHEIVTTGKLSKLEHFESDEKVRTISLFGEVWGIGPATALKLYEKGHRSLDDLKSDYTLTNSQKLGLKYFEDIRTRIPRDEVQEMECLLQKAAEDVLSGVSVVCGGSFRRGKATCGDMDISYRFSAKVCKSFERYELFKRGSGLQYPQ